MDSTMMKRVVVIGAGDMGHGIAQLALMAGFDVTLCDVYEQSLENGISRIYKSLFRLAEKEKVEKSIIKEAKEGRLKGVLDISEAVSAADLIIEAVPEREDIKRNVLQKADVCAPEHSIIASNTSNMDITKLSHMTNRPDKVIGMHFFNPALYMKLVELVCGDDTSEETEEIAVKFVTMIGKEFIVAKKYIPGFIANRIASPVNILRNVLLNEGTVDIEDVDITMQKAGIKMGLFMLTDFCGLDVTKDGMEYFAECVSPEYAPAQMICDMVKEGNYGKKSGKGFYVWPEKGIPILDESRYSGSFDPAIPYILEANEACRLVEQGICSLEDCDKAMLYGYNTPGPISIIRDIPPKTVTEKLEALAQKYGKKSFMPCDMIRQGKYRQ